MHVCRGRVGRERVIFRECGRSGGREVAGSRVGGCLFVCGGGGGDMRERVGGRGAGLSIAPFLQQCINKSETKRIS